MTLRELPLSDSKTFCITLHAKIQRRILMIAIIRTVCISLASATTICWLTCLLVVPNSWIRRSFSNLYPASPSIVSSCEMAMISMRASRKWTVSEVHSLILKMSWPTTWSRSKVCASTTRRRRLSCTLKTCYWSLSTAYCQSWRSILCSWIKCTCSIGNSSTSPNKGRLRSRVRSAMKCPKLSERSFLIGDSFSRMSLWGIWWYAIQFGCCSWWTTLIKPSQTWCICFLTMSFKFPLKFWGWSSERVSSLYHRVCPFVRVVELIHHRSPAAC